MPQRLDRIPFPRPLGLPASLRSAADWLVYVLVRVILCVVQATPIEAWERWSSTLGWWGYDIFQIRRGIIDDNLAHAFPEYSDLRRQEIARGMWRHLVLMICELAHLPRKIHETNWRRYVECREVDRQVDLFLSPRPLVVVSGHFGNFEVGGILAGLLGFPTYTIARPLDNPYLHRFITRHRSAKGQYMLPKTGSAKDADRILAAGGTLVLLGDQNAGPKGCWVPFLNRPASCHKAIALFALAHQAPLAISYTRRLSQALHFEVGIAAVFDPREHPQANVRQVTEWYNQQLEALVRQTPEQYWWIHRRWKDAPLPMRRRPPVAREAAG